MYPSAAHELEAFIARSRGREEAIWARRLEILRVAMIADWDGFLRISPPVRLEELLEVGRLALEMKNEVPTQ